MLGMAYGSKAYGESKGKKVRNYEFLIRGRFCNTYANFVIPNGDFIMRSADLQYEKCRFVI